MELLDNPILKERAETIIFESAMKEITDNGEITEYSYDNIRSLKLF